MIQVSYVDQVFDDVLIVSGDGPLHASGVLPQALGNLGGLRHFPRWRFAFSVVPHEQKQIDLLADPRLGFHELGYCSMGGQTEGERTLLLKIQARSFFSTNI